MVGVNPYKLKIISDKILVKLDFPKNTEINFAGGKLLMTSDFTPAEHAKVHVEVVQTPIKMSKPSIETVANGIEWLPQMELKRGDKIIIDYFGAMNNFGTMVHRFMEYSNDLYIIYEGEYFVFINYHEAWAKIEENGELTPLNGYIIFEGIHKTKKALEYEKKLFNSALGIAKYVGKSNLEYFDEGVKDNEDIVSGDEFVFRKGMYRKLEYNIHAKFDKNFYLVQKRYVLAKQK